jgi:hypothetical protein
MYSITIFQEAQKHCRWKKVLDNILKDINISIYENKSFEQIFMDIYIISKNVRGIGLLTIYDITSAICRFHKINIDKVYIIGNGPKRAVKLLSLDMKIHRISSDIKIKYVDINEIISAFDKKSFGLDESIRNNKNADFFETFLCNWQKSFTTYDLNL